MKQKTDFVNLAHKIQRRASPADKFYTPLALVEKHIEHIKDLIEPNKTIYEPFSGDKRYVRLLREKFPNNNVIHTEIDDGEDFFEFHEPVDYIITNPPYSKMDKVLEHLIELKPSLISMLIGYLNVTPKRIADMNAKGYYIERILFAKVKNWFGVSAIITFSNLINKNIVEFERELFHN
jgi:hypothetical protein